MDTELTELSHFHKVAQTELDMENTHMHLLAIKEKEMLDKIHKIMSYTSSTIKSRTETVLKYTY